MDYEEKNSRKEYNRYELEDLKIYHAYMDLMNYEYDKMFDKYDNNIALKTRIEDSLLKGLELIIKYSKEKEKTVKFKILNSLDVTLKVLMTYVRICKKLKIINGRNYKAACGKVSAINNMLLGCMKICAKQ